MSPFARRLTTFVMAAALIPSIVAAQGVVRVFGTVRNQTGAPLPGAVVWIQDLPARTQADGQGRFVLAVTVAEPHPGAGVYAGSSGYQPAGFIVPLDPTNPPRLPVEIVLQPAAPPPSPTYQAAPAPTVVPPPDTPAQPVYVQTYSAGPQDGLPSPVGYDTAASTAPKGFETKEVRFIMGRPVIVETPKPTARPTPPARPTAPPPPPTPTGPPVDFEIEGRVLNERGGPVAGAQVTFANRNDVYAETDKRGNFKLVIKVPQARVKMGRTLVVQHKNFIARHIPIEFNPDEEAGLNLPGIKLQRYRGLLR